MLGNVFSITAFGLDTKTIEVEVNAGSGWPGIKIVGLPNKSVQESEERVKTALQNCGIKFPGKKITINLAPADISKQGPVFDLPIAMGILHALEYITIQSKQKVFFLGELSLNGSIRRISGALPAVLHAKKMGADAIIIPQENKEEVEIISGISIHPTQHISQLIEHFKIQSALPLLETKPFFSLPTESYAVDFADVHGQEMAKRALEISAAGAHNVFLNGSPGAGKSMMAKAMASILPPLTENEAIDITRIYSVSGLLETGMIRTRPFRSPHHTISQVGLIGGGSKLKPGEISLSHQGVLFLDEFPEFSSYCIEALRQPLEDHQVHIVRAAGSTSYPAHFTLIAAANPCPCGHLLSKHKACICSPMAIEKYQKKISGPILDRIDIHVHVQEVELNKLIGHDTRSVQSSASIREHVIQARSRQAERYKGTTYLTNSELNSQAVKQYILLTPPVKNLLESAAQRFQLSARGYFKVIKVAQTIADLEDSSTVTTEHIAEALQFRGGV